MRYSEQDRDRIVAEWRRMFGVYHAHDDYSIQIDFEQAEELLKLAQYDPRMREVRVAIPFRKLREWRGDP